MSLVQHMETVTWPGLRERIVADFRDFRFTWSGFFRWTGIVVAAFLFAAIVTLYFLDWNQMRGVVGRYASARSGREVRIDGNLKVDLFRWRPHVSVGGLYIGNANSADPAWTGRPQAARIDQTDLEFRLFPAIMGNWILPLLKVDHPDLLLMRDAVGRTNWDQTVQGPAASWHIPPIQRFLVQNGHVEIDDAVRKLKFIGTISSEEQAGGGRAAFLLDGDGTLNGNKFLANVHGGPLLNVDETKPYAFNADIHSGQTHVTISGTITHPFNLDQFQAQADFSGPNLGDLYDLTGLALPGTPPYQLSGALKRDGGYYTFTDIKGVVGGSDLHGFLSVDVSGTIPDLKGHLSSRTLNFDDLGALFRGGKTALADDQWLLPDVTLHTEKLRELNGELDYDADAIASQDFPLRGLATHVSVENGVLTLKPLAFSFTTGKLSGSVRIDARTNVPVTSLDARITDIHIEHFFKSADKPVEGTVEARAQLTGSGSSVHKVGSSATGTLTAVIPSGQMRHSLAEWLGVNVISALGLTLSGDQSNTNIRCAVAHFSAKDGVMTAQQFVFDTDPVRMDGQGTVNMKDESLNLTLQGKPKSFQLFHLRAPISISGKLAAPSLGFDAKPAIAQAAIGVGLGLVNPFAGILAFVDPGMAKNANCADALSVAKTQGAPVKQSAVNKAAASDAAKK
jgi:AsmA family protein